MLPKLETSPLCMSLTIYRMHCRSKEILITPCQVKICSMSSCCQTFQRRHTWIWTHILRCISPQQEADKGTDPAAPATAASEHPPSTEAQQQRGRQNSSLGNHHCLLSWPHPPIGCQQME